MFAARRASVEILKNVRHKHCLPELPYKYEDLEPTISRDIMCLHHQKHHQAYINNLNIAEEKLQKAVEKGDLKTVLALGPALRFNGGGHLNHSIFWKNLSACTTKPTPDLCDAIDDSFGDMENMKKQLSAAAVGVQGSGWAWLGYCKQSKSLKIMACGNQDALEPTTGLVPLFGIDVWEHAYYLQYKNVRPDYVKAIFDIMNWKDISERYKNAQNPASCNN